MRSTMQDDVAATAFHGETYRYVLKFGVRRRVQNSRYGWRGPQLHLGQGCRSEVVSRNLLVRREALDWVVSADLILGANGDIDWARMTCHREPTTTTALASKPVAGAFAERPPSYPNVAWVQYIGRRIAERPPTLMRVFDASIAQLGRATDKHVFVLV
ncbi:hypothetical protein MAPG_01632 [Magnaporthiopsis poae ATCC 64411]|uniref:Uncharacterized protein n=1 Tax=Magnaporthiopsis poae (strain ATCC 64411 / 73-15) TaxID=644358 RepID=A0A0C4DP78_MAGP6|nr:hypothetical protein MAPG_01632 [Magnaporthiopsis poae ATCC 64411]